MASKLEPRIEAIRVKYDLQHDDFWQIKQNGQWVCKHAALEIIAVKANVEWLPPQIIEANAPALVTSMVVTGKMGDRVEWATGETNETNYSIRGKQPAYPWAMSEKRAKDRVVLKLVGIHGLVYSENEAEAFKDQAGTEAAPAEAPQPASKAASRDVYDRLSRANRALTSEAEFNKFWATPSVMDAVKTLPADWKQSLKAEKDDMAAELAERAKAAADDSFPGDDADNQKAA